MIFFSWHLSVSLSAHTLSDKRRIKIAMLFSVVPGMVILVLVYHILKKILKRGNWMHLTLPNHHHLVSYTFRLRGSNIKLGQESSKENEEVALFDLASIDTATNSFFQENLIGIGRFGPVYRVRLTTWSDNGQKSFYVFLDLKNQEC